MIPESFKVLVKELQALSISVETLGAKMVQKALESEEGKVIEEVTQLQEVLEMKPTADKGELEAENSPFEVLEASAQEEKEKEENNE